MADIQQRGAVLHIDDVRSTGAPTIVSWEPEPPGIGLAVTCELIRKHTARVTLAGELDYFAVEQTRDALMSALPWAVNWIEADAGALGYCDLAGLEMLLEFDRRCVEQAGGLRIVGAQRQLIRLLELAAMSELVTPLGSLIG